MKTKRLAILENSLKKKKDKLDERFDSYFADVKQANGQPLNDKRNGPATLRRWEKKNQAIRYMRDSIKKTEEAIEWEILNIKACEATKKDLPKPILDLLEIGTLTQWRKHPNRFFVAGVDKARILYKDAKVWCLYTQQIPPEQRPIFKAVFNGLANKINK